MFVFIFMLCASIFLLFHVKVGLDQELAMPQVSPSEGGSLHSGVIIIKPAPLSAAGLLYAQVL